MSGEEDKIKSDLIKKYIDTTGKHILDVTCSNRSMWFEKDCPIALYCDKRKCVETVYMKNNRHQDCVVNPDVVCDFTNLPFKDESFELVVFDPPHAVNLAESSWTCKRYGSLDSNWQSVIKGGIDECLRVLKKYGTLIFKWSDCHIPTADVIKAIGIQPLFGHRSGKKMNTHWMVFMKK